MSTKTPKRRKNTRVLIVLAEERAGRERTLALRGYENGVDDMEALIAGMIKAIRKRFPEYAHVKPKDLRKSLAWPVYQIHTGHGGWPEHRGYAEEWIEYGGWE